MTVMDLVGVVSTLVVFSAVLGLCGTTIWLLVRKQ